MGKINCSPSSDYIVISDCKCHDVRRYDIITFSGLDLIFMNSIVSLYCDHCGRVSSPKLQHFKLTMYVDSRKLPFPLVAAVTSLNIHLCMYVSACVERNIINILQYVS